MSTHNISFNEEISKTIFKLSSNMYFICSSGNSEFLIQVEQYWHFQMSFFLFFFPFFSIIIFFFCMVVPMCDMVDHVQTVFHLRLLC